MDRLADEIKSLKDQIKTLTQSLADSTATIKQKDSVISERDSKITGLESEIKRLNNLMNQNGLESSELANRLAQSQKAVTDLEEKLRKMTAELLASN
jgi:chromosome segregation ATPase